jgi:hypothetical protein
MSDPERRLEAELARLGTEHMPPVGWETRVLAATVLPKRRPWWHFAAPAFALAAAIILWFAWPRSTAKPTALALELSLERGGPIVRGSTAHIGDVLHATARGGKYRAVWIYRTDTQLLVACPGAAACTAADDAVTATAAIQSVGDYSIVALSSDAPLAAPTGKLDADVAAAANAGARYKIEPLAVR